jgi:threonine aldolase
VSRSERERDAIYARCERAISHVPPPRRRPAAVLAALADASGPDLEPDLYGKGEAVERLEKRIARLLGTEEAVVMPSGTMAQQIALRIAADRRGIRSVAFHPRCHLELHEEKGYQLLHGLHGRLVGDPDRLLTLEDLQAVHEPLAALLLELPQREIGGLLPSWDDLVALTTAARARGLHLHMDGARLWESQPFYGKSHADIASLFDSVYVSLYKGLAGIAGCVLAGTQPVIGEARVWRSRHGGTLHSLYPYALAGERGLDEALPQMGRYWERARRLAAALAEHPDLEVVPDPPQTPMFHLFLRGDAERLVDAALDVATERATWVFGALRPTRHPAVQRLEISVGEATLELSTREIRSLFDEILERAAARPAARKRRPARTSSDG